jgi:DNA-directed RNA polymerase sigma subunit (sigma70/sigma32)
MTSKKDELAQHYADYRLSPSPERLAKVVSALEPTINYSVVSTGGIDDAAIRGQARLYAAQAIHSFDPQSGAELPTWVSRNLMQLRRFKRSRNSPMKLPERVQLDAYAIDKAEKELTDKHDREPSMDELATHCGMPIKRIRKVREAFRRTPGEGGLPEGVGNEQEQDFGPEALDYVYADADATDQKIIETMTGYNGKLSLSPKDAAIKLGITPSTLSRRRQRLGLLVQDMERSLQGISHL